MIQNLARAGLQSGSIMTVADIATQLLIEKRTFSPSQLNLKKQPQQQEDQQQVNYFEPQRTLRWSLAGFTMHGPYFFYGSGGTTMTFRKVLRKTAIAQFIAFPPYLVGLFTLMGVLEGVPSVTEHVLNKVPDAFAGGCIFWPIVNMINFAFVPPTVRVPYLAGVGSIWNCFLSWLNAHHQDEESTTAVTTDNVAQ